jgi:hypothetical protein
MIYSILVKKITYSINGKMKLFLFWLQKMQLFKKNLVHKRNDKPLKTHTQCGEAGDRIPIMTSDTTISAFN